MSPQTTNSDLSQSTFRAGLLQSQAYRALTQFMTSHLETYGLSLPEWSFLGILTENPELRPTEIATALGIKQPGVTRIAHKLRGKGLLQTTTHPQDSRGSFLALSQEGLKLTHTIEVNLRSEMQTFLADIKHTDLAVYVQVLTKIAAKG